MQQKSLPKNVYKLYSYARTQESLDRHRLPLEKVVRNWKALSESGSDVKAIQSALGISRATYYRKKKVLRNLAKGIFPQSKRPRNVRKPCWTESEILKRDFGWEKSESTVGRILKSLMEKGLVARSISAPRIKKKREFGRHAIPWTFKKYEEMTLGERVQVDHMTLIVDLTSNFA
jgi:predicted transcriptional regulator